jgi:adenylosuccinate synthase
VSVTAVIGAGFGSEGKGAAIASMAHKFDVAVRTGGPNAGHSFWKDGIVYKMQSIPVPWFNPDCELILGAGAVIDEHQLRGEIDLTGRTPLIDHQAIFISDEDVAWEKGSSLTHQGSTLEGVGAARITKIRRDVDGLDPLARSHWAPTFDTVQMLWERLNKGERVLLEGTQGSGLSLHHGYWPHVTSADTNAGQLLADAGIAPSWLTHTLLVARTFPIRVGGPSGPMKGEMQWSDFPGIEPEKTTVTKKIRRIGKWDPEVFARAVQLNAPCGFCLTFLDYIDPGLRGATYAATILSSKKAVAFIKMVEAAAGVPCVKVGTGGERFEMTSLQPCTHGETW